MNDSFKASRDAPIDVADVLAPLRHLENLEEISLDNNGLVGRVPPLCSLASFDRSLEILRWRGTRCRARRRRTWGVSPACDRSIWLVTG